MSKSQALSTVPSMEASILHVRDYHQIAMNGAAQTACAAVMVGLELRKVQKTLKSLSGCTFESWLDENLERVGFGRATAFKYLKLAETLKGKLLEAEERSVIGLLDKAPSDLLPAQTKSLLLAVRKSVDGKSLTELYEDFGIARQPHALKNSRDRSQDADAIPSMDVPIAQQIDEQLELFAKSFLDLEKKVKIGNDDVLLISQWPARKLDEAIAIKKRELQLLVKTRQAVKS